MNNAKKFWKTYAEQDFVSLKRHENGNYEGVALDFGDDGEASFGEEVPYSITRQELIDYKYESDDAFAPCVFANLASALVSVLRDPELAEPTVPNCHRLRLVIRLIRDPSPAEPTYSNVLRTRNAVRDYAEKKIQKGQCFGQLRSLREDTDGSYGTLCHAVLKYLDEGAFSAEQAANLLYAITPIADVNYILVLRMVLETLPDCELSIDKTCRFLEALLPTKEDYAEMEGSGRISRVHTERDVLIKALSMCQTDERITAQLVRIMDNHENEDLFTVIETISALGIHNDKSCIPRLVECLGRDDMGRYRDMIEEALQLLCSGPALIPRAVFGMDFSGYTEEELEALDNNKDQEPKIEHAYWCEKAQTLPATPADWLRQDAESVFWQKRLRCALAGEGSRIPPHLLNALRNDEVMTVRISCGGPESIGN